MADWTTTRLNLRYHWKTVLLWGLLFGGLLAWGLVGRANAWVENPFAPRGLRTVVVNVFCQSPRCFGPAGERPPWGSGPFTQAEWLQAVRDAVQQWNAVGVVRLQTRAKRAGEDPCAEEPGTAVIILADEGRQDQGCYHEAIPADAGAIYYAPRIYINTLHGGGLPHLRRLLVHELGHVLRLGHPNEAGQTVRSIMNSNMACSLPDEPFEYCDTVQPDDMQGIYALHDNVGPYPGDYDYCSDTFPCEEGEGDCDGQNECQAGLVCGQDRGAAYGWEAIVDVCEAPGHGTGPDPDYCGYNDCGAGEGDCDPGQCGGGLVCVNDVGAQYGLPAHYDVCEVAEGNQPDPDYCVSHYCGLGAGDCDPGQCDEGVCVNDVGAQYGLPAHYDVCEAGGGPQPDPDYCVNNTCGIGDGDCDPGQCTEGTCVADVGANYGLPAHYDVCEAESSTEPGFDGRWQFIYREIANTCPLGTEVVSTSEGYRNPDFETQCTISNGLFSCPNTTIKGTVTTAGVVSGRYGSNGEGAWEGHLRNENGSGTWQSPDTCRGTWTARFLDPITGRVCSILQGLAVEDYEGNLARWDITSPCAPWQGFAQVLHVDMTALGPLAFTVDIEELKIEQGDQAASDPRDYEIQWIMRDTRTSVPYELPYQQTYRTTLIIHLRSGLDLRQPFTLYYEDRLVAIFE